MTNTRNLKIAAAFLLTQLSVIVVGQGEQYAGRTITGTAYFFGARTRVPTRQFTLRINRLSSQEEVSQLNSALQSGGQDELLRVLSRMNAGRITVGTGVGVVANAIMATEDEGRTRLTVLFQRNVSFGELRVGARSADYRFGYAELFVGRGTNEGMLIPGARVRLRDGTWEIEDFGTWPARLMGLRVRGGGREAVQ